VRLVDDHPRSGCLARSCSILLFSLRWVPLNSADARRVVAISARLDLSQQFGDLAVVLTRGLEIVSCVGVIDPREQATKLAQEALPST
jgi:hypothetical protein